VRNKKQKISQAMSYQPVHKNKNFNKAIPHGVPASPKSNFANAILPVLPTNP